MMKLKYVLDGWDEIMEETILRICFLQSCSRICQLNLRLQDFCFLINHKTQDLVHSLPMTLEA